MVTTFIFKSQTSITWDFFILKNKKRPYFQYISMRHGLQLDNISITSHWHVLNKKQDYIVCLLTPEKLAIEMLALAGQILYNHQMAGKLALACQAKKHALDAWLTNTVLPPSP